MGDPMDFPAPCRCTDPKGHRADCPAGGATPDEYAAELAHPGDYYVKFARVGQRSYVGEGYDLAMSRGLPRSRAEREIL